MRIYESTWGDEKDPDGMSVDASFHENGHLVVRGVDFGPGMESHTGSDDREYLLVVDAVGVQDFILELLKSTFNGHRPMTVRRLERICQNADIDFRRVDQ